MGCVGAAADLLVRLLLGAQRSDDCTMSILRKHGRSGASWRNPLVRCRWDDSARQGRAIGREFFANKAMWRGLPWFVLLSVNGLHAYFPEVPGLTRTASLPLFRDSVRLDLWFSPPWIGFFYFVNLDISASIWVFYVLTTVQRGIFNVIGMQSTERMDLYSREPYIAHQGMGAMIVFVLIGLWVSRGHLRAVWRKAWHDDPAVDDADEILSYRQATFGLLASLGLVGWLDGGRAAVGRGDVYLWGDGAVFGLRRVVAEGAFGRCVLPL